jgi:2-haloacid dehalogenase
MDLTKFETLSFDCYGTLIDWETGILSALRPITAAHGATASDAELLRHYAEIEPQIQAEGYRRYREVLREVVAGLGKRLGFSPTEAEKDSLPESLKTWQPFPDTLPALRRLKSRYKLAIISNIDDDLFAASEKLLEVPFDHVVTAQQVGAYKPSLRNFEVALERMVIPRERLLHVAESLFHDVAPARRLGIASVWVNRRAAKGGVAASGTADVQPDLTVTDLKALADGAGV